MNSRQNSFEIAGEINNRCGTPVNFSSYLIKYQHKF
jgi:hypothetical protein